MLKFYLTEKIFCHSDWLCSTTPELVGNSGNDLS